jgi:transcriptional regulator with XRE-family HTH domain
MIRVGARIRQLRRQRGVTQGELVRRSGLQASYLSKVENGVVLPGLVNLDRIARALGVSLADLVTAPPRKKRSP